MDNKNDYETNNIKKICIIEEPIKNKNTKKPKLKFFLSFFFFI